MLNTVKFSYNTNSILDYTFKLISKKLRIGWISSSGRNFSGRICVHHRGGGDKKCYYHIDFFRRVNRYGFLIKKFKISFFTSLVGWIVYENGLSSYILLSDYNELHRKLYSGTFGKKVPLVVGSALPIKFSKLFTTLNNVESYPFSGSILARSAGVSVMLTALTINTGTLKLKSGWNLKISNNCIASIGAVSNSNHRVNAVYKKAGLVRSLGIRPTVRGVAMNPCDHPHGGGEGKKSPLVSAKTPWGRLTKGTKTVVNLNSTRKWKIKIKKKK